MCNGPNRFPDDIAFFMDGKIVLSFNKQLKFMNYIALNELSKKEKIYFIFENNDWCWGSQESFNVCERKTIKKYYINLISDIVNICKEYNIQLAPELRNPNDAFIFTNSEYYELTNNIIFD